MCLLLARWIVIILMTLAWASSTDCCKFLFSIRMVTFFFSCFTVRFSEGLKGKLKMVEKSPLFCLEVLFAMLGWLLM